ncbi:MAG: ABC transporter substrate-binding protein [Emcibacter sp.]|nr:ABC transporter substrate-binding protein [Emcibacter sp.]
MDDNEMQKNTNMNAVSRTKVLNPENKARRIFIATLSTLLLLGALLWTQSLWAADKKLHINQDPAVQAEVADFVQRLADKALTSLNQKDFTLADKENRFREILSEGFDVKYIGKISLGRHRKKASAEDLKAYYALFPEYLVRVYTSRLTKLDTRTVEVGKVLPNGKRDMYVRTVVIDGEEKTYDVDWRVRPQKMVENEDMPQVRQYKIIDVKIEGISMARTQRDDFAARISESGVSGLIDFMRKLVDDTVMVADNNSDDNAASKD